MQTFVRHGNVRDVCQLWLSYLQLAFWGISVNFFGGVDLQSFSHLLSTFPSTCLQYTQQSGHVSTSVSFGSNRLASGRHSSKA